MDRSNGFASIFVTAQDGLRLHVRSYGPPFTEALPVVCLPGLTRTAGDFHRLASALSSDPDRPRRVLAIEARGRGLSDYDRDAGNYNLAVELGDVLAVLTACEAAPAVFIGTSRGGLVTMLLAATRPTAIAGVVLNDIGPVIETQGLMRIKSYVGKLPEPRTLAEGADILRRLSGAQFTRLTAADWTAAAELAWKPQGSRLVPTYDIALARTLDGFDPERPFPPLWPQFDALAGIALMAVRGANSDLLSPATIAMMRERHPDMTVLEIADQGHAPLLVEPDTIARIAGFVAACDSARKR